MDRKKLSQVRQFSNAIMFVERVGQFEHFTTHFPQKVTCEPNLWWEYGYLWFSDGFACLLPLYQSLAKEIFKYLFQENLTFLRDTKPDRFPCYVVLLLISFYIVVVTFN